MLSLKACTNSCAPTLKSLEFNSYTRAYGQVRFKQLGSSLKSWKTLIMSAEKSIHLSAKQIKELIHYGHVIPMSRGWTQKYVEENFPGWEWNDIVPVLIEKNIFKYVKRRSRLDMGFVRSVEIEDRLSLDKKIK